MFYHSVKFDINVSVMMLGWSKGAIIRTGNYLFYVPQITPKSKPKVCAK